MRNAERHVLQGKIRAAIAEYKKVVDNDPRDFATLNMLGDLYVKNADKKAAIQCYKTVAEHYHKQGFSQKAIAIYKKVSKLEPNSVEISAKLAELYQIKGSLSEARSHYTTLAEHYRSQGKIIEALTIWKQIAVLDPNDTEVFINLAESYLQEKQEDEAADAYAEAGARLFRAGRFKEALTNYSCSLGIKSGSLKALEGLVSVHGQLGTTGEAVAAIEQLLEAQPYNREALCLLIDCHLAAGDAPAAERAMVRLVEQEPANYPKFVDLTRIYLDKGDAPSASRALSLCIENLLVGGQKDECRKWVEEILYKEPEQPGGLRLLARVASWDRDDKTLLDALTKLASVSNASGSVEDERYALSQLVMLVPQDSGYADRLRELNEKYGFSENPYDEALLRGQFEDQVAEAVASTDDGLEFLHNGGRHSKDAAAAAHDGIGGHLEALAGLERGEAHEAAVEHLEEPVPAHEPAAEAEEALSETAAIEKEIESIRFYIQNGYADLARTAIGDLRAAYGLRPEFKQLETELKNAPPDPGPQEVPHVEIEVMPAEPIANGNGNGNGNGHGSKRFDLDEIRSEFGLDEPEEVDDGDYETRYQMAVAYQEMGLMEEAIKEFQDAISLVKPDDPKRRFFHCANLMGHCFMQNGMAKLALKWFSRALETPDLNGDEKMGIWYELASAYEADGDLKNAERYLEQVYAEDVDYRDIAERMRNLTVAA